jgi:hypothetical protein
VVVDRKNGARTLNRLQSSFLELPEKKLGEINPLLIEKWCAKRIKAGRNDGNRSTFFGFTPVWVLAKWFLVICGHTTIVTERHSNGEIAFRSWFAC